jgi:Raf kinase inhibitor-like YbhB/YbcL family protein
MVMAVETAVWVLSSPAFGNNQRMPEAHACDGENISPALEWTEPPKGTKSLALICEDMDAATVKWIHWVLYDLPADLRELPEGVSALVLSRLGGGKEGRNSFDKAGYSGPCPPPGERHHYYFRLFALEKVLGLPPLASEEDLNMALEGHVIAETELIGLYSSR